MERDPYDYRDEVSLRELWLILRGGLTGIVISAVIVGAAAFLVTTVRPNVYVASATVRVTPPQPPSDNPELAALVPPVTLGAQAYTSLANSLPVLKAALGPAANVPDELRRLRDGLKVRAADTSTQTRGQLTMVHEARGRTAQEAADHANAWAAATATAVVAGMRTEIDRTQEAVEHEYAARSQEADAAQVEWTAFLREDARTSLRSQLDELARRQSQAAARLDELDALVSATRAQLDLLVAAEDAQGGVSSSELDTQVRTLAEAGALPEGMAVDLSAALAALPPGASASNQDLVALVRRVRIETLTSQLAGYVAERGQLAQREDQLEATAMALRERLADLEQRATGPTARLAAARAAQSRLEAALPLLALQQRQVASAAGVVIDASAPLEPQPRNRLTITLAAALVAGLLATLFVFLRAAVAEPVPAPVARPARVPSEIDPHSGTVTRHDEELLTVASPERR